MTNISLTKTTMGKTTVAKFLQRKRIWIDKNGQKIKEEAPDE